MKTKDAVVIEHVDLDQFKRDVMDRIEAVFTSKPTWSAWPIAEYDMIKAIEQIVHDQTDLLKHRIK